MLAWIRKFAAAASSQTEMVARKLEQGAPVGAPVEVRLFGSRLADLNAAANVDRAVEALVRRWWEKVGRDDCAILVSADHGQSIYDSGFLGHGQSVNQTQTPCLWRGG